MFRILLVEDDHPLRRALRISLEKSGYEVVEASGGREALAAFKRQPVDLVITDIIMPEMEGLETIHALRKLSPYLLIVAMSGGGRSTPEEYLRLAQQFGAVKVFAKPFEPGALCAAVASLLSGTGATASSGGSG